MNDLRFAVRQLLKSPGFTTVAVLTLALGIGANTALFSIVEAVLLRPLPYPDADRLVELSDSHRRDPVLAEYGASGPNFQDWRAGSRSFANLGMYQWSSFWVSEGEQLRQVRGLFVTANLLSTLGVRPMLGRGLLPEDEKAGGVALLGYEMWRRVFGADTNLAGKTIMVNDRREAVIGVMPPGFGLAFPGRPELWAPLRDQSDLMRQRDHRMGGVIGRLQAGVSRRQAQAEMDVIARRLSEQYPEANRDWGVRVSSLHGKMTQHLRPALPVMLGVVGFILLIVCANLGNLLLARAAAREKELAIRAALGARRWRLVRQMVVESLLLAGLGGIVGLCAVIASRGLLAVWLGPFLPRYVMIRIDGTVWLFALLVAVLTGLVCGLIPAWRVSRTDLNHTLKEGGHCGAADRAGSWLRSTLVVSEVALALVLLIGAGLTLRSVYFLLHAGLEVDPAQVLVFEVELPDTHYPKKSPQRTEFFAQLLARTEALPGVEAAGTAMFTPFADRVQNPVVFEGRPPGVGAPAPWAGWTSVSPGFFKALGLSIRDGRGFSAEDRKGAPEVAVVNETMARRYWPGENPIGKRFAPGHGEPQGGWLTVVGVVRDPRAGSGGASGTPDYYCCSHQVPWFQAVVVRATTDPMRLVPQIQSVARTLDKRVPLESIRTLDRLLGDEAAETRLLGELLSGFAALALTLALVGIFGVIAYTVSQRTHEFGLRMALGARGTDVSRLVVGWGGRLALLGVALGLALAWGLTRLMASLLNGVSPTDPATFIGVALLVLAAALLACWLPARRAARVDPMVALRRE